MRENQLEAGSQKSEVRSEKPPTSVISLLAITLPRTSTTRLKKREPRSSAFGHRTKKKLNDKR